MALPTAFERMARDEVCLSRAQAAQLVRLFDSPPADERGAADATGEGSDGDGGGGGGGGGGGSSGDSSGWLAAEAVTDNAGVCSHSGLSLRAFEVSDAERQELLAVVPRLLGRTQKLDELETFADWMRRQEAQHGPYTYVLDGANIGFHGHSKKESALRKERQAARTTADGRASEATSEGGAPAGKGSKPGKSSLSFAQIDGVLSAARRVADGGRGLVVLHCSHTNPAALELADRERVERWRREGALYATPAGMNDDWFWLHGAVAAGAGCAVISNDEMRDHHFGMLSSRTFLKWKERHVVHFTIPYTGAPSESMRLVHPLPYSHTMQAHPCGSWHVPCADDEPPESAPPPAAMHGHAGLQLYEHTPRRWVCLLPTKVPTGAPANAPTTQEGGGGRDDRARR